MCSVLEQLNSILNSVPCGISLHLIQFLLPKGCHAFSNDPYANQ